MLTHTSHQLQQFSVPNRDDRLPGVMQAPAVAPSPCPLPQPAVEREPKCADPYARADRALSKLRFRAEAVAKVAKTFGSLRFRTKLLASSAALNLSPDKALVFHRSLVFGRTVAEAAKAFGQQRDTPKLLASSATRSLSCDSLLGHSQTKPQTITQCQMARERMKANRLRHAVLVSLLTATCLCQVGCLLVTPCRGTRVEEFDPPLAEPHKTGMVPLDLTLLTQQKPPTHIVGPGDVLNVFIQGVLPPGTTSTPTVQQPNANLQLEYYPPNGVLNGPSFGVPLQVTTTGVIRFPLIDDLDVSGLTVREVEDLLREQYVAKGIVEPGREKIVVTLSRSRVYRVLVIREDSAGDFPQMLNKQAVPYTKRGRAEVVDLPAFENDVLHALTATGGLPGIDAKNEVLILRSTDAISLLDASSCGVGQVIRDVSEKATKIPLRVCQCHPEPFQPTDVILNQGDIVFVPARDEYYYTAGLLPAGKIPLPRDDDLDVVEAIALSGGSTGGFGGSSGGSAIFRSGGFGGVIPPSMVAVVRKSADGSQTLIRVDLAKAMKDPKERIVIQPNDVVYLHYTHAELFGNMVLNLLNFNFLVDTGISL